MLSWSHRSLRKPFTQIKHIQSTLAFFPVPELYFCICIVLQWCWFFNWFPCVLRNSPQTQGGSPVLWEPRCVRCCQVLPERSGMWQKSLRLRAWRLMADCVKGLTLTPYHVPTTYLLPRASVYFQQLWIGMFPHRTLTVERWCLELQIASKSPEMWNGCSAGSRWWFCSQHLSPVRAVVEGAACALGKSIGNAEIPESITVMERQGV